MTDHTQREVLIQALDKLEPRYENQDWNERVAEFILEDRKRTIEDYKAIFFCDCDKQP